MQSLAANPSREKNWAQNLHSFLFSIVKKKKKKKSDPVNLLKLFKYGGSGITSASLCGKASAIRKSVSVTLQLRHFNFTM